MFKLAISDMNNSERGNPTEKKLIKINIYDATKYQVTIKMLPVSQ